MAVTIRNRSTIKPAGETLMIKISLSETDQLNPITHAPTIYFYRLTDAANDEHPFASAVETLKTSLSKVLVHFHPLAGRLNWLPGNQNRLELDCNAKGAEIYEAESNLCIDDYGDFRPSPELRHLIPFADYSSARIDEIPLLMAQITKFRCGGRSIGLAISHTVADGVAAMHFITEWTRIARGLPISRAPYLDRTTPWQITNDQRKHASLPEQEFDHPELKPDLPLVVGSKNNLEEKRKATRVLVLKLTKPQVESIQNNANTSIDENLKRRPYSRYEAVAAHMWKTLSKARNHKPEQVTSLRIAVDIRQRIQPPLPENYFGNAVLPVLAVTNARDLVEKPLSYSAGLIRDTVEKITDGYIRSAIKVSSAQEDMNKFRSFHSLECTMGNFFGNPNAAVTSWINLPLYGTDFGWGEEIHMGPGALGFDGKCFVQQARERDGSLGIVMRLQVDHTESFNKFFYQDI